MGDGLWSGLGVGEVTAGTPGLLGVGEGPIGVEIGVAGALTREGLGDGVGECEGEGEVVGKGVGLGEGVGAKNVAE